MIGSLDDVLFVGSTAFVVACVLGVKVTVIIGLCWFIDIGIEAALSYRRAS